MAHIVWLLMVTDQICNFSLCHSNDGRRYYYRTEHFEQVVVIVGVQISGTAAAAAVDAGASVYRVTLDLAMSDDSDANSFAGDVIVVGDTSLIDETDTDFVHETAAVIDAFVSPVPSADGGV